MRTHHLNVLRRTEEATDVVSFHLAVPDELHGNFTCDAGRFINLSVDLDGQPLQRAYSLSSLFPVDPWVRITVKRVAGGRVSNWLIDRIREGDRLAVSEPVGRFFASHPTPVHAVLLGAGSGVAPLVPMARTLVRSGGHRLTIACGQRTADDVILGEELRHLADLKDCTVHVRLSRPHAEWAGERGRVDGAWVRAQLDGWKEGGLPLVFYLCGPGAFMSEVEQALREAGVCEEAIRKESFDLVPDDDLTQPDLMVHGEQPGQEGGCTKVLAQIGGQTVECTPSQPGQSLLSLLIEHEADVPFSCMEGTCASCMVKVRHGSVAMRPSAMQVLRPSDLDEGIILACLSLPRSTEVHLDFDDI